ncbi:hypothetical protein DY000_02053155 [Brassica cretica]|uniref:Uncharacterized protein n=1 Tax=Brassica cretica TaxID=69181 RepID=A0ABQ7AF99_BRACR|nr:hypothetical protein DY000_02053155 [Brassica cretica]
MHPKHPPGPENTRKYSGKNRDGRIPLPMAKRALRRETTTPLPPGSNPNLPPPSIPAAYPHSPDYSPTESSPSRSRSPSPPSRDAPYRLRSKAAASDRKPPPSRIKELVIRLGAGILGAVNKLGTSVPSPI